MNLPLDNIICHDIAKGIPLPDKSIDMVITSPPYWGLRDYGKQVKSIFGDNPNCKHKWGQPLPKGGRKKRLEDGDKKHSKTGIAEGFALASGGNFCKICGAWQGQLGLEPHPQMYINHLVQICKEIRRVLKKTGSFYLDLGDTYCSTPKGSIKEYNGTDGLFNRKATRYGKIKKPSIFGGNWLQPKQLMLIPSRVAIALQNDGWILRNDIIWYKPNHMPSSVKDRLNNTFEHIFHFVKSKKYYYDLDSIREPHTESSIKRNEYGRKDLSENMMGFGGFHREIKAGEMCNPLGKNPGDFWSITTQPFTGFNPDLEHFAVFPEELVLKPLKATCPQLICKKCGKPKKKIIESGGYNDAFNIRVKDVKEGRIKHTDRIASEKEIKNYNEDSYISKIRKHIVSSGCNCNADFRPGIVLDPFCGRGTVGKVAKQLGLHYILFDIKPEYCELACLYIAGQKYKLHKDQTELKI